MHFHSQKKKCRKMNVEVYLNSRSFCKTLILDHLEIFNFRAHLSVGPF